MYDPQVFEGLLGNGRFSGVRGDYQLSGMTWRECDGVFYEVDARAGGMNIFVSTLDWHCPLGNPDML